MTTTLCFTILLSCYILYNTSKKVVFNHSISLGTWSQNHKKKAKLIGTAMLLCSYILAVIFFGIASGIIMNTIILMTILSLLVVLNPIKLVSPKYWVLFFIIAITVETLLS